MQLIRALVTGAAVAAAMVVPAGSVSAAPSAGDSYQPYGVIGPFTYLEDCNKTRREYDLWYTVGYCYGGAYGYYFGYTDP